MPELEIRNLHVQAEDKQILKGVDLTVKPGEIHALMGPNGSGKSTLANAIMGHPSLEVTEGQILFGGEDITEADTDERARMGLFMAFQYPVAIPGVTITKYLRMVMNAHREARGEADVSLKEFRKTVEAAMELVNVPREFSSRYLNEGFSGGEKKRLEILQLALQKPKLAVLDETDSGLDIDALNVVAHGVNTVASGQDMGILIITHYQRILHMVTPTRVSIMFDGRIATEGGPELVDRLEAEGYAGIREEVGAGRRRRDEHPGRHAAGHGLPLPAARGDRLHGLGCDVADAAAGHRRDGRLLRAPSRHRAPQRLRPRGGGDRAVRGRPRPHRGVHELAGGVHDLHEERDRGAEPRRVLVGPGQPRRGRHRRRHAARASLELRALAHALPGDRRRVSRWSRSTTSAGSTWTRSTRCWPPAPSSSSPSATSPTPPARSTRSPRSSSRAHAAGAVVVVDGSQAVPQMPVDLGELDADFYAWTGHKLYGPTGIGVLHGRKELLDAMPPFLGGGHMIASVSVDEIRWGQLPAKFEAGTSNIAEAIGLGAAVDFVSGIGMESVRAHERDLCAYALERLAELPDVTVMGPLDADRRGALVAFTLDIAHPHDIAEILGSSGVCVRAGHHCAQPLMQRFGVAATTRASFAVHNTRADVDALIDGLDDVRKIFG